MWVKRSPQVQHLLLLAAPLPLLLLLLLQPQCVQPTCPMHLPSVFSCSASRWYACINLLYPQRTGMHGQQCLKILLAFSCGKNTQIYVSLVGDRLEGAEAGSWQAALDAAVQSAPAHITMQLGPALFYTLLHGSANKVTWIHMYTHLSTLDVGIELIWFFWFSQVHQDCFLKACSRKVT